MRKSYQLTFDTPRRACNDCKTLFYSENHQELYCQGCRTMRKRVASKKYKQHCGVATVYKPVMREEEVKELRVLHDPNGLFTNGEFNSDEIRDMVEDEYMVGSLIEHIASGITWKAEEWCRLYPYTISQRR